MGKIDLLCVGMILLLCISHFGPVCGLEDENKSCQYAINALTESISSLEKATNFLLRNQHHMIIDTAGSVAMSRGYLVRILRKLRKDFPLNRNKNQLYKKLFKIFNKHRTIIRLCKKNQEKMSFSDLRGIFTNSWVYEVDLVGSDHSLVYKPEDINTEILKEKIQSCVSEAFKKKKCKKGVKKSCWNMLLKDPAKGKSDMLAHLALYLIAADLNGCQQALVNMSGDPAIFKKRQQYFVSNLFSQSFSLLGEQTIERDPFIENLVFGQFLGGIDLYRLDWLKMVTSWQDECGCWKEIDHHHTIRPYQSLRSFQTARNQTNNRLWKTILGVEVTEECCNMHETGLGLTNAAAHIHWLLFPPSYSDLGMKSPLGKCSPLASL